MADVMAEEKFNAIREVCTTVIGSTIERFETAEICYCDGTWDDWPDLPIRIFFTDEKLLSISWSRFEDLWLSNDTSLPFAVEEATTRWKTNGVAEITAAVGHTLQSVMLGREQMAIGAHEFEIWPRLLFDLGGMWLEVYNALDENGYILHAAQPDGEFRKCL